MLQLAKTVLQIGPYRSENVPDVTNDAWVEWSADGAGFHSFLVSASQLL